MDREDFNEISQLGLQIADLGAEIKELKVLDEEQSYVIEKLQLENDGLKEKLALSKPKVRLVARGIGLRLGEPINGKDSK